MKFIKVITLTLIGFSSQALSTTASAPIDQFDEGQSRDRFLRDQGGQSMANPDNCPAPSRRQVIGNQCLGPNQVPTVCCGRNKMRSYVACMPRNLPTCFTGGRGSQNFATRTTTLSALPHSVEQDSEDYGGRGGHGGYGR